MNVYIATDKDYFKVLPPIIKKEFDLTSETAQNVVTHDIYGLKNHLNQLKDNCFFVIETNYVDKVYRDSYYHYYSSKLKIYKRNCIRISIFDGEIKAEDFRKKDGIANLKSSYRGFIVLRPTEPSIVGRNLISPKVLKNNSFLTCSTTVPTTVHSIKMKVEGFPHSSQDGETISCAETTIWAIMEYFSHKYPQYKSVLPSNIISTLYSVSAERQIPSRGLNIEQMSYTLKEFGFGTRIYSREEYKNNFENILSCYIESGIPLIVAVETPKGITPRIGHAMLCTGYEPRQDYMIDSLCETFIHSKKLKDVITSKNIKIFDNDDIRKKYIFIDDNLPVYQKNSLNKPCENYDSKKYQNWDTCILTHFLAPLYSKIYLETFQAKSFVRSFLIEGPAPLSNNSEVFLRTYLTSSRSYKDWLVCSDFSPPDLKEYLLKLPMPKFVWITEVTTKELIKCTNPKTEGIVILDATEPNTFNYKALIFAAYKNHQIKYSEKKDCFEDISIPLPSFSIFENLINYSND